MAKLEVRNLTISFRTNNGAVRAVRDISFSLNAGETLAVAGESGSSKSVTARAVMGILAGNAMVEGGEIIYDGKDLLKIPEEEFHALRGHRLAMVFQDPLSALNPIMHIGKQLTEAMILNNKERRQDGKRRFDQLLKALEADIPADDKARVKSDIAAFRKVCEASAGQLNEFTSAQESAVGALDCLDEIAEAVQAKEPEAVGDGVHRLTQQVHQMQNPRLVRDGSALKAALDKVGSLGHRYSRQNEQAITQALEALKPLLQQAAEAETPDFFVEQWAKQGGDVMPRFRRDIAQALGVSRERSRRQRTEAVQALKEALPAFEKESLVRSECLQAAQKATQAVKKCIDPLALEKDNLSWIFESTLKTGIERYFYGVVQNPKEEKRFRKETEQYERLEKKGKATASVVPMNLVDLKRVQGSLSGAIRELIAHYEAMAEPAPHDDEAEAEAVIETLKACARDYSYQLTNAMARHRAIELMKEVGIPQPHKRFDQYPFEFSGGMRQRIVIAIALSANPDILICDEPTTALDVTIQAQILELINRLKRERDLSVIFITHDLGVVANMADRIAVMYAGKIVEYGTADDVFYDPRHPYTWALLASMPDLETKEKLAAIPGTPPNMIVPPKGDAFAARNRYAMEIDLEQQPPMFQVSDTHWAATWLMHPDAPKVEPPAIVLERIHRMQRLEAGKGGEKA